MSEKKKLMMDLIEKDKKEQRELYEGNKSLESTIDTRNKAFAENSEEIKRRLEEVNGQVSGRSEKTSLGTSDMISGAFSEVLSIVEFSFISDMSVPFSI